MPHLVVDSAERIRGTVENYTVRVFSPLKDVRSIRLIGAQIPRSFYPIVKDFNDDLVFNSATIGSDSTITIPAGNYTGPSLATQLTNLMNAVYAIPPNINPTILVKYNAVLNKFTVRFLAPLPAAFILGETSLFFRYGSLSTVKKRVAHVWGFHDPTQFVNGSDVYTLPNVDHEFPEQSDLSYPRQLYLNVGIAQWQGQDVWTDRNSHSFYLPMSGTNFGELQNWSSESFYHQPTHPSNVNGQEVRIEWRTSDPRYTLDFHNVNHQLLFEVITV